MPLPPAEAEALETIASEYVRPYCGGDTAAPPPTLLPQEEDSGPCLWPWVSCQDNHVWKIALRGGCEYGGTFPMDLLRVFTRLRHVQLAHLGLVGKAFDGIGMYALQSADLSGNAWEDFRPERDYYALEMSSVGLFLFVAVYVFLMWVAGAFSGYATRNC